MKSILAVSGGLDSTVLLYERIKAGDEIERLCFFYYGSKHNRKEWLAICNIADKLKLPEIALRGAHYDLSQIFNYHFKSTLLNNSDEKIPEGHYEAESMKKTVVPGRNLIFLSMMAGLAESTGTKSVFIGIHAGDRAIYPDCRPEFFIKARDAIVLSTENRVVIQAPFLFINKAAIVKRGIELNVPFELTRTCYTSDAVACGKCGSCQERLVSFAANGIEDPLEYQSREILPKEPK